MSDRDEDEGGFLGRWSRRKREARKLPDATEAKTLPLATDPAPADPVVEEEPEFDLSTLPPLESLGPGSDFTLFLKRGVPKALRNAALRKAWTSDPVIANFREVADYDWDFNAPGYGQLLPTDNVKKLLENMFSRRDPAPQPDAPQADVPQPAGPRRDTLTADADPSDNPADAGADDSPAPVLEQQPPSDHIRLTTSEQLKAPSPRTADLSAPNDKHSNDLVRAAGNEQQDSSGPVPDGDQEEVPVQRRRRHGGAAPH